MKQELAPRGVGIPGLQAGEDVNEEDTRQAAYREVLAEWEKPWGLSAGKTFIERLRAMIKKTGESDGRT